MTLAAAQLWLGPAPMWFRVDKFDARAARLADRHYSRQTVGADQCLGPGQTLLMLSLDELAVWGVVCNLDPVGALRWCNSLFHSESPKRASSLIEKATDMTRDYWSRHYGGWPDAPLTTEIDVTATARHRSPWHPPGWCYLKAGWRKVRDIAASHGRSAKVELEAP
jgi:hypothetical protein